jgi:methyl-accepting chemotaxis protein
MGFAVAADEVRNLAQRCAQAARDTANPIADSIAKSGDGQSKLALVAGALGSITESAARVKSLVDEVSSGSVEPSRGIEQVAKAIVQMGKVAQSTAAIAKQSASASRELSAESEAVRGIAARLTRLVGARSRPV